MIIAIDGPSGSGKSTIAKILAKKLGISYLDTGAMYRGIAYYVIKKGIEVTDEAAVIEALKDISMQISKTDGVQQVIVNGENVTPYIRENSVSMAASTVSKIPAVRIKLVELQRKIASESDCVLDGRDIGSYVLPNADYKFYLTADSRVRAVRRQAELAQKGQILTVDEIQKDIEARDLQDTTRAFAPLVICSDAMFLDTSALSIDEVTDIVLKHICR